MIKIYGTSQCPDCRNCKENFDKSGIAYEFTDILSSLVEFKKFLLARDNKPEFDRFKKNGKIGIPCLVDEDGKIFFDWENYLEKQGYEPNKTEKNACSIDGKGC